ncbi:cytochrome c biogenesis protein CcdA, partial [Calditrichota bacterium]
MMFANNIIKTVLIFLLIFSFTLLAQSESHLTAKLLFPVEQMANQSSYHILLEINIADGWHINSNLPLEDFLIATEVTFDQVDGVTFGRVKYTEPELKDFAFSENKMSVYEGKIYAQTTITLLPNIQSEKITISGAVYYQACDDQSCLAPTEYIFSKQIKVAANISDVISANQELFDLVLPQFQETKSIVEKYKSLADVIAESGMIYAFIFIFIGGLALNLTPCVYPLIPITISYFGGQSEGKKGGLVLRAIIYVLGMSITYSVLGVVASLTGGLLGAALQNPFVLIFVALVLIGLALSMFGLYEIRVPQSLAMIGGANRSGY